MIRGGTSHFVMHRPLFSGLLLAAAASLLILFSGWLDLELDATVLLGVALGAVVALVPDATAGRRLAGFALGFFVSVVSYYVRAAFTPDTTSGRAVYVALAIVLCVGVVMLSMRMLPLWSVLLGAGAFAGAFEAIYAAAPTRVFDNSLDTMTALALCVAVGFLVSAAVGSQREQRHTTHEATPDEQMESAK